MAHYQFLIDTYETERLKVLSVWSMFKDEHLPFSTTPDRSSVDAAFMNRWCTNA